MDTIASALKNEIDETIRTLSQNKNPDSIFNSVNRTITKIPINQGHTFLFKLYEHYSNTPNSESDKELSKRAYMCASAYAIQSQREIECGDHASALKRINKANYFLGRSLEALRHSESSVYDLATTDTMAQTLKAYGAIGGSKRDEKRAPARQEAARLLFELKPEGGWTSKVNAAENIVTKLSAFITEHERENKINLEINPDEEKLINTILKWMGNEKYVVVDAYNKTASPNALKRIKNKLNGPEDGLATPSVEL